MHRDNVRATTDNLLMSRAMKRLEHYEQVWRPEETWRTEILGVVLVMILATICLVLAFAPPVTP